MGSQRTDPLTVLLGHDHQAVVPAVQAIDSLASSTELTRPGLQLCAASCFGLRTLTEPVAPVWDQAGDILDETLRLSQRATAKFL
jgi:hypothetical protein